MTSRTAAERLPAVQTAVATLPVTVGIIALKSQIGSARCRVDRLPSTGLAIRPQGKNGVLNRIESALRALPRPIIGRIEDGALLPRPALPLAAHEEAVFIAALDAFRCA